MFYLAVEEYTMQNRQRELAQELELKRQLYNSPESQSNFGLHLLAEAGRRLRSLELVFKADPRSSSDNETALDCVVC